MSDLNTNNQQAATQSLPPARNMGGGLVKNAPDELEEINKSDINRRNNVITIISFPFLLVVLPVWIYLLWALSSSSKLFKSIITVVLVIPTFLSGGLSIIFVINLGIFSILIHLVAISSIILLLGNIFTISKLKIGKRIEEIWIPAIGIIVCQSIISFLWFRILVSYSGMIAN